VRLHREPACRQGELCRQPHAPVDGGVLQLGDVGGEEPVHVGQRRVGQRRVDRGALAAEGRLPAAAHGVRLAQHELAAPFVLHQAMRIELDPRQHDLVTAQLGHAHAARRAHDDPVVRLRARLPMHRAERRRERASGQPLQHHGMRRQAQQRGHAGLDPPRSQAQGVGPFAGRGAQQARRGPREAPGQGDEQQHAAPENDEDAAHHKLLAIV
jgi:hypothetical protein